MRRVKQDGVKLMKNMAKEDCFLCGEIDLSLLIYQNDDFVVVLDKYPAVEGHLIVAPKKHVEAVSDLSADQATKLMSLIQRFDKRLREVFNPFRVAIVSSGLAVKHLHFHIIPIPNEKMMWGFKYLQKNETIKYSDSDKKNLIDKLKF